MTPFHSFYYRTLNKHASSPEPFLARFRTFAFLSSYKEHHYFGTYPACASSNSSAHTARQLGNFGEALALYREMLQGWQEIGHRGAVAHQLECFAFIAKAQEEGERSRGFARSQQLTKDTAGT